ncbi:5-methyltetrahydrofolate:corrinoid/iron-sulfur protein co-methyltransferase [Oxobacter pfennigii]|uniref:5-methyltetrahydrofolate:corrinoid/iron-sulfur protein co-methyltransferase n=1 Tax=Oxobacter pfennigii TaxID=36849 RepID=A0A0N8NT46_9CLOT|nr:dihydropteroate synthase [Oxobacter pfennigii]KPU43816.1 5-methyltetrahydrofolate:corrinoid/iron-sulfur protein co-methyltransferase [Oxobacter pfennigii]
MEIIGERINGMFKDIREAIKNKDKTAVHEWAIKQTNNGAAWLDISTGAAAEDPMDAMKWLVETVQEVVNTPLAIDTTNYDIMEEALKLCKRPALINSCHADRYKIERVFPMAVKYGAKVIALAMSEESGIPKTADARVALAMELVAAADEFGLPFDDLYIDPLLLPVNVAQDHGVEAMEALRQIKLLSDPPPKTTCGLSNISQKCANRKLLNRTMLVMLMACGLDSAIADAADDDLMEAAATARIIMNKEIYCDSYIDLYKTNKY